MERNPDTLLRDMERHDAAALADGMDTITARLQSHAAAMPHQVAYTLLRDDGKTDDLT